MEFGRLLTAMITPFQADGRLDESGLKTLIDHLLATGTTAIVASGTTGESPTLSHDEKLRLFELTVQHVAGRVPVLAGTGGNNTETSLTLSREAVEIGVDGLLLVSPYYNRPSQDGLYAHFRTIAEAAKVPVMLYNIPGRTGVNIDTGTILKLAELPNVVAVKEASGNFAQIAQIAAEKPDDFFLYSGDDKFTLPMMALGAFGIVSVASHVVGPEMSEMIAAFVEGNVGEAAVWSGRLLPIFEALFQAPSPAPLKAAMEFLGLPGGTVRLPLVAAPESLVEQLRFELGRLGKI
ncbi:MAG: 4-hydroxy-tetrahydrodipicolinate synthase [Alicyclobacillus sp. RIFOXYA1_FULL_53_8]|nr:MAG: 4-hydroxy-tetrahydrodipicolinate synthase [Alicyclobacillus sp. RIFOXYA1_FULL_53_8]